MTPTFGVVGLGRMAQALLFPLLEAGLVQREGVRAVVASEASATCLAQTHGLTVATDAAVSKPEKANPVVCVPAPAKFLLAVAKFPPAAQTSGVIALYFNNSVVVLYHI